MATENVGIFIDSKADLKGFKQAETAAQKLGKTVKGLATALGVAYGTKAVVQFGKAAAQAFMEDQKGATRLANAVKNLGLEFSNPAIAQYIEGLSKATSVTDDQLRPAFQALLQTTGSITQSQKLLAQAIDVSAGSGIDLATVSQDLANGYVGITKGLKKYNLGLTAAELKTASFTDLTKRLNDQYKGANAAYLETYAGKITAIGTAAGEAKEKIGGALIDSTMLISGSASVDDLINKIDKLASKTVDFIDRISLGIAELNAIKNSNLGNISENIQAVQVEAYNQKLRRSYMDAWKGVDIPKTAAQTAAEKKAEADAKKRAAALLAAQNKQTAELKKQAALKKAQSIFDMQNIQLVAALKGELTEDEKNRVKALLALNNDNVDAAKYYSDLVVKAQDKTGALAQFIRSLPDAKNPFAFLDTWIIEFQKKLNNLKFPDLTPIAPNSGIVQGFTPNTVYPTNPLKPGDPGYIGPVIPSTNASSSGAVPNFIPDTSMYGTPKGTVQGPITLTVTGDSALTKAIADSLQVQSLSGIPSSVQRLVSTFG